MIVFRRDGSIGLSIITTEAREVGVGPTIYLLLVVLATSEGGAKKLELDWEG